MRVAVHDRARSAGDRVGVPDHVAELDQVEAGRLGQSLRLGGRGERDEVHQVAGQLELGAGADRPGVHHPRAHPGEHRLAGRERVGLAADHDRQGAVGRAHRAAAHRRVDHAYVVAAGRDLELARRRRRDRRVHHHDQPVAGGTERLAEHVTHLVVVEDHHAQHVDLGRHRGHAVGGLRPGRDQLGDRLGRDVVHPELEVVLGRRGREPQRHRLADVAESHEPDARHDVDTCLDTCPR